MGSCPQKDYAEVFLRRFNALFQVVCVCACVCACVRVRVRVHTCVGEDSLDSTPILCMHVHVVLLCCAVAQYSDTEDRSC